MAKYSVNIPEIHYLTIEVEAANEEEAKSAAVRAVDVGMLDEYNIEYSHTSDISEWRVTEMK